MRKRHASQYANFGSLRIPLSQWFNEQYDKLRQSIRQPIQQKKGRGMKM